MVQLVPYATSHSKLLFPHFVRHDQLLTNPVIEEYAEHIKAGDAKVQSTMTHSNIQNGKFNRDQCYGFYSEILGVVKLINLTTFINLEFSLRNFKIHVLSNCR